MLALMTEKALTAEPEGDRWTAFQNSCIECRSTYRVSPGGHWIACCHWRPSREAGDWPWPWLILDSQVRQRDCPHLGLWWEHPSRTGYSRLPLWCQENLWIPGMALKKDSVSTWSLWFLFWNIRNLQQSNVHWDLYDVIEGALSWKSEVSCLTSGLKFVFYCFMW